MSDNIGISLAGIVDIAKEYDVNIRKAGNTVEWKFSGETDEFWRFLIDITELNSKSIEMQRGDTHLQWRLVGSDEWIDLISYADIAYKGSQPIRDEFNRRLTIVGRTIQDNLSPPEPIDYMKGEPIAWRDGEYLDVDFLPMSPIISKNTFTVTDNKMKLWPIQVNNDICIKNLSFNVVTPADAEIKILLYEGDKLCGTPVKKIFESSYYDCSTSGVKLQQHVLFLDAGFYFIGYKKIGNGQPILRSISDTSYNIITSFQSLIECSDTSNVSNNKSCYEYETDDEDLSDVQYNIGSSHRIIYSMINANCNGQIYYSHLLNCGVSNITDCFWSEYEQVFYLTNGSTIYKYTLNGVLTQMICDLSEETYQYFTSITESRDGRVVAATPLSIFIKQVDSNEFINSGLIIEKGYYGESRAIYLFSSCYDDHFFCIYAFNTGSDMRCDEFNIHTLNRRNRFWVSEGLVAYADPIGVRLEDGNWLFWAVNYGPAFLSHYNITTKVRTYKAQIQSLNQTGTIGTCPGTNIVYAIYRTNANTITYIFISYDNGITWSEEILHPNLDNGTFWSLGFNNISFLFSRSGKKATNNTLFYVPSLTAQYQTEEYPTNTSSHIRELNWLIERNKPLDTFFICKNTGEILFYKYSTK